MHRRIVGQGIAVHAEQRATRLPLEHELLGPRPALPERDGAVAEPEHADHAIAVEPDIVPGQRRKLRVRRDAIEGAVQLGRHRALDDLQSRDIGLDAGRREEAAEIRCPGEVHGDHSTLKRAGAARKDGDDEHQPAVAAMIGQRLARMPKRKARPSTS